MNILINASNLKQGGGIQVADSICTSLDRYPMHHFSVVLSSHFNCTSKKISKYENVCCYTYDIKNNLNTIILGRDKFLDDIVIYDRIDVVLTIFGPSRWNPKCAHLSGFALAFLVIPESPYFKRMHGLDKIKALLRNTMWKFFFKRSTQFFYTENPFISERLKRVFKLKEVFTVTNYYNQVFDNPESYSKTVLDRFDGTTILTIANAYPHKNLLISVDIAKWLILNRPKFNFRFVFTVDETKFPLLDSILRKHFVFLGSVDISECPSLYQQSDIAFQPSLLECFTATYPEAMKMEVPNVTVDLPFAHGLCGDAAVYYDSLSAEEAAKKIYMVATDEDLAKKLVKAGKKKLLTFDDYNKRSEKLIQLCEKIVSTRK